MTVIHFMYVFAGKYLPESFSGAHMPVSHDEIVQGYRFLLGRDPESEDVINMHASACEDVAEFRRRLWGSAEFLVKAVAVAPNAAGSRPLPLSLPANEIEADISREQLTQCLAKVKQAWTHLGLTKPHWSVLVAERYLPENLEARLDEFWESSESDLRNIHAIAARHGFNLNRNTTVVEYGCGVGRVTTKLAQRFGRVHAYDISANHLHLAQEHAKQLGIDTIAFHECADQPLAALEKCDLFFSCIVFQHNPPPIIKELTRLALESLNVGGLAIFQIPTYAIDYRFNLDDWLSKDDHLSMQMHVLPQHHVFEVARETGCEVLEVREDECTGQRDKYVSNTFVIRKPGK
ncbi:class I SAM-dependent methyltransferase [Paraburkholderia sp. EG287A]|uniref:class I SAM-dependent methyltransferase n=1 Tax=Paraburkholderia sp. EG287A TaxID=3237012 RepID=UPI0034D1BA8E